MIHLCSRIVGNLMLNSGQCSSVNEPLHLQRSALSQVHLLKDHQGLDLKLEHIWLGRRYLLMAEILQRYCLVYLSFALSSLKNHWISCCLHCPLGIALEHHLKRKISWGPKAIRAIRHSISHNTSNINRQQGEIFVHVSRKREHLHLETREITA